MITIETARTPKPDDTVSRVSDGPEDSSFDMFADSDMPEFTPKLGIFGAPMCRLTTSVITLIGMMIGLVLLTSGTCIVLFFTQEPTVAPLGVTLVSIGGLLVFIGLIMWVSEFACNDCLGRVYHKVKAAPLKNAIRRREKLASRLSNRTGSRLSQMSGVSMRTTGTEVTSVQSRY